MKRLKSIVIYILLTTTGFGQKSSWVTYFPAQSDLVGQMCTGDSKDDLFLSRIPDFTVELETYKSYDLLDKEQKKSLLVKFGEAFQISNVKVQDVYAKHIYADRIKAERLANVAPGVQFVYSGLRADTVSIILERERRIQVNPKEIVEKIKAAFPNLPTYQIETLLANDLKDSTRTKFTLTISDPKVYFMIQTASIQLEPMKTMRGTEWVKAFGEYKDGKCNINVTEFTLNASNPVSCYAEAKVPSGKGAEIKCELRVSNGKLFLRHQTADLKSTFDKELIIEGGKLIETIGIFIYRYPFETKKKEIRFKEIYLCIDVTKTDKGFKILNKAGEKNFPTRISYPNSNIIVRRWKQ